MSGRRLAVRGLYSMYQQVVCSVELIIFAHIQHYTLPRPTRRRERHRALAPFRVRTRDDRHLEDIGVGSEFYSLSDEDTFM